MGKWDLQVIAERNPQLAMRVVEIMDQRKRKRQRSAILAQAKQAHRNIVDRPWSSDTMGEQTMAIHPVLDVDAAHYFKDSEGDPDHQWKDDPDKVKHLQKLNPALKVKARGTRIQSGWTPGTIVKFHKSYG